MVQGSPAAAPSFGSPNTGPAVPAAELAGCSGSFQRLGDLPADWVGIGLGLLTYGPSPRPTMHTRAEALPGGGLDIQVWFLPVPTGPPRGAHPPAGPGGQAGKQFAAAC